MQIVDEADVVAIQDFFSDLTDPRSSINRKHLLSEILVIAICAVICGADGPKAIGRWALAKAEWLKTILTLPHGIPSHDTFGRVLAALKPAAFQTCFTHWTAQLQRAHPSCATNDVKQIAIDGKALRRSHDQSKSLGPLFLVSAWSVECGLSLGQLATAQKSNEITAIPALLNEIEVRGTIVTIDAAGCQKNIARQIVDGGGDYIFSLKGNHKQIHRDVASWITEQEANHFDQAKFQKISEAEKSHGRETTYWYVQLEVPESLRGRQQWANLTTLGMARRYSQQGNKTTMDTRYFLSSLTLDVHRFAKGVRRHWSIENTLHWCLDVTFCEDESRLRNRHAADNLAWLKRFALGLLKQMNDKESVAMRRRMAGWNNDYLAQVLTQKGS